jgi:tetratricopeptide (TPR) repeat protein
MDLKIKAVAQMIREEKKFMFDSPLRVIMYSIVAMLVLFLPQSAFPAASESSPVEVQALRHGAYPDYERVVVDMSSEGTFSFNRLSDPERLYVDIDNAKVGNSVDRKFKPDNGFLKMVRIGQYDKQTVRVVFDVETPAYEEKIFTLDDPPRLVVDIFPKDAMKDETFQVAKKTGAKGTSADSPSFDDGLKAEVAKDWEKAIAIYKSLLKEEPKRSDLWLRIADIEWHLGNKDKAADALKTATQISPDDPVLNFRLSKVYSSLNKPGLALDEIEKAVALDPKNKEYLEARAMIAGWIGKHEIASDSYKRILALTPDDKDALINLARSQVRSGAYAEAEGTFKAYADKYPEDSDISKELEEDALQAELEGRWQDALMTYRSLVTKEPERVDLWVRIGQLEYSRDNYKDAAQAFLKAAELSPHDPTIYYQLYQSYFYPDTDESQQALEAIERAIELDPDNIEYLKAKAGLANWSGRADIAVETYKRIVEISPDDETALLDLARSQSWNNELDDSVKNYKLYLEKYPDDKEVLIEYASVEGWRGNYPTALSILEKYREKFGETDDYLKHKARILAWAQRPTEAIELTLPLLEKDPQDYELHVTNTIAMHYANRPQEAVDSLQVLEDLRPDSLEVDGIRRYIMTPLRSYIQGGLKYYHDSDSIDIIYTYLQGEYALSPVTFLRAGIENDHLHADAGSGYEQIDGEEDIWYSSLWVGIRHRFSPKVAFEGDIGGSKAGSEEKFPTYRLAFDFRFSDEFSMKLEREYDYFIISPRALSLGIRIGENRLQLSWAPDLKYFVYAHAEYDTLSDDNKLWEFLLAPRRTFLRGGKFNLDIGITCQWYGYEEQNLNHGYWDPEFYQSYLITGYGYWKVNEDNALSIVLSGGIQKDDTVSTFREGFDVNVEGLFGIYRDWMLVVRGGVTHNIQQRTGAYDGVSAGVWLTRRF